MVDWQKRGQVARSVFESIGFTPLVELSRVSKGIKADILVKVEWFSPTGSHTVSYTHLTLPTIYSV